MKKIRIEKMFDGEVVCSNNESNIITLTKNTAEQMLAEYIQSHFNGTCTCKVTGKSCLGGQYVNEDISKKEVLSLMDNNIVKIYFSKEEYIRDQQDMIMKGFHIEHAQDIDNNRGLQVEYSMK